MRDYKETLEWYRTHQTTKEIGFNPDNMCLKVCRTGRDIEPKFLTAKISQDATPLAHRFNKVRDLRKGMVLYFDDPFDSNTAGHIVTMIGRVRGFDPDSLHDILVETNSVKSREVVVVRGDYFAEHWGDEFQFGATWLNGHVLDVFTKKAKPPVGQARLENFSGSRPDWDVKILDRVAEKNPEVARTVKRIEKAVESLPDDQQDTRVRQFVEQFNDDRTLNMRLLNAAVNDGRTGKVLEVRTELRSLIKSLLPR